MSLVRGSEDKVLLLIVEGEVPTTKHVESDDCVNARAKFSSEPGQVRYHDREILLLYRTRMKAWQRDILRDEMLVEKGHIPRHSVQSQLSCRPRVNHAWVRAGIQQQVLMIQVSQASLHYDHIALVEFEGNPRAVVESKGGGACATIASGSGDCEVDKG